MPGTIYTERLTTNSDGFNQKSNSDDDYQRKLFLGGLSPNSTEESIANFYCQFGEVTNVVIKRDPATQRSKGFGFVTYKDATSIEVAQAARPHIIDGKVVDSKPALPRGEATKTPNCSERKIFIGGLKDNHDEESLIRYFEKFGNILAVKILVDRNTGRKRGFAFVEFATSDGVEKATILRNHTINDLSVEVKRSNYKHDQTRRLINPAITAQTASPMPGSSYSVNPYALPTTYTQQQVTGYNTWGTSSSVYPQQTQSPYAGYAAVIPQNELTPAWNGQYGQQVYGSTPGTVTTAVHSNEWNVQPQSAEAYYAQYQQSYNGGPQKVAYLHANRMNPYST